MKRTMNEQIESSLAQQEKMACELIVKLFKGKTDKGGYPYLRHLYKVEESIRDKEIWDGVNDGSTLHLYYYKARIVALLHDIVEDTDVTLKDLSEKYGFDDEIVNAVGAITRKDDDIYYFDFINRVNKNDIARLVKIYDLEDNMNIKRLKTLEDKDLKRIKKYWYCWKYLKGEISPKECNDAIHKNRKFNE